MTILCFISCLDMELKGKMVYCNISALLIKYIFKKKINIIDYVSILPALVNGFHFVSQN